MSITAITSMLVGPVADLIGKFIPDKDQAAKLAHDIAIMAATQAHQQAMGQVEDMCLGLVLERDRTSCVRHMV
jgi:hypothetical protein